MPGGEVTPVADECPLYLSSNTSQSAAICSCVIRVTRTRYPVPVPVPVPVPGSRWLVTILTNDAAVSPCPQLSPGHLLPPVQGLVTI